MASLLSCPTELIDSILEHVSFRDLAAMSLMNKKLHESATSLLYSHIDFRIFRDNPRPVIHLCRSIFRKPELAKYIKSVRLRDGEEKIKELHRESWRHQDKTPKVVPPKPTDEDGMPEFVSFIEKTGLSYADIWVEKLREGNLNAFVALLLSKLPNLARFRTGYATVLPYLEQEKWERVKPQTKGENQFLGKIFQSAVYDTSNHGISRFEHLEEISFPGPMDTDPGRNPDFSNPKDMIALLSLPSMRSISGWCLNPSSLPFTWPTESPALTQLTSLSLSFVNIDFLAQILEKAPSLKSLSWEWKYIPGVDPLNTDTIDLDRFIEALKPVQDTLEDLTIKCTHNVAWDDFDPPNIEVRGSLNGLESFINIKRFKAPFILLLPDWDYEEVETRRIEDSMPPNVEVVTVTDEKMPESYGYNEISEVAKLQAWISRTASTRTPHLAEVCLYLVYGSEWVRCEAEDDYHGFRQIFEGSNVTYRIIKAEDEEPWENV